jgi:hypothetical protein
MHELPVNITFFRDPGQRILKKHPEKMNLPVVKNDLYRFCTVIDLAQETCLEQGEERNQDNEEQAADERYDHQDGFCNSHDDYHDYEGKYVFEPANLSDGCEDGAEVEGFTHTSGPGKPDDPDDLEQGDDDCENNDNNNADNERTGTAIILVPSPEMPAITSGAMARIATIITGIA